MYDQEKIDRNLYKGFDFMFDYVNNHDQPFTYSVFRPNKSALSSGFSVI